jgi:hypothetical protein
VYYSIDARYRTRIYFSSGREGTIHERKCVSKFFNLFKKIKTFVNNTVMHSLFIENFFSDTGVLNSRPGTC